nr:hypothetical protein [Tanacetum cinerariifolium]
MPNTDTINTTTTTNVAQNVVEENNDNLPQLLDSRGEIRTELCLAYEKPSDTRDTKIAALRLMSNAFKELEGEKVNDTYTRLKCLLNDLENNEVIISQSEVNDTFVNSLPRKWLSMIQTQRANNSIKNNKRKGDKGKSDKGLITNPWRKGRRQYNNSQKEVLFAKANVSTTESALMITSDSEDDRDDQEPLPLLSKLTRAKPSGALKNLISLSDLTANMADLTLNIASKETKKSSNKVSQTYVIKKRTEPKHLTVQTSWPDKNALPSTEQLLLTLMEEVKGIKNQIMIPSDTSSSVS